jgi:protocatechuate 3,4-dioxygenase, beta subunit
MSMSKRSFLVAAGQLAAVTASGLMLPRWANAGTPLPNGAPASPPPVPLLPLTPAGDLGPFYPVQKPLDSDADLTRLRGRKGRALGEVVEISGRILSQGGTPQAYARIEVWQANAAGRYAHSNDRRSDVPLDPNFQGYAELRADAEGYFRFLTIKPGTYPAGSFLRAPHLHFDVRGRNQRLVTQLYFPSDEALLRQDKVLLHDLWGRGEPFPAHLFGQLQTAESKLQPGAPNYQFDVVLFDGFVSG